MGWFKPSSDNADGNNTAITYPCLAGQAVLETYPRHVQNIQRSISATPIIYDKVYNVTLCRFAELCQHMPLSQTQTKSLLETQLELCATVLRLSKGKLLPDGASSELIAKEEPRYTYALFSASLLYQMYRLQLDRRVILHNRQNQPVVQWHVISGALGEVGQHFSIDWQPADIAFPIETLMASLVARLIPACAINWLLENPALFAEWWEILIDKTSTHKPLYKLIQQAIEHTKYPTFDVSKVKTMQVEVPTSHAPPDEITVVMQQNSKKSQNSHPIELLLDFADNYAIQAAKPLWLRVTDGLLMTQTLLDAFTQEFSNWDTTELMKQLQPVLIHHNNSYCHRYRPTAFEDRRFLEGIVINVTALSSYWREKPLTTNFQLDIQ